MELICIEDYTDTKYKLKVGDCTCNILGMSDEYKESMFKDYPNKFKVVEAEVKEKQPEVESEKKPAKKVKA